MKTLTLSRRDFLATTAASAAALAMPQAFAQPSASAYDLVAKTDRERILTAANRYLNEQPVTVTSAHSERSSGGPHDYFSEGDYWWPDPKNPSGPYIRRDGYSNPQNFNTHREALIRLSLIAPALAAAWRLTKDQKYSEHFTKHLRAWFVDPATRMNPNLQYAQAIWGVSKGRGTGIIDTLHLVEVVRAARVLEAAGGLATPDATPIRGWFADYVNWMATSANGKDEENAKNNHGTCWILQVAEFAQFATRADLVALCRERFKNNIVPDQIAKDGRLPLELARTKPYSYSLFDADVLSGICQSLSNAKDDLWTFHSENSGTVGETVAFLYPYIADKSKWPFPKDVEYFDDFPCRRPCLLFAGLALHHPEYIDLWKRLPADSTVPEVIRNMPIRQPLLWVDPIVSGRKI